MLVAGEYATFDCYSYYTPPRWLFYGIAPATTPCSFDNSSSALPLCSAVPRISVAYSSQEDNKTTLTILSTELADAGTYTCGSDDPTIRYWTSSIIVGVMGTRTLRLHSGRLKVSRIPTRHCERLTKLLFIRYDTRCYFNMRSKADMSQLNLPHGNN